MVFHNGRLKPNMTPMIVVLNYMTSQLDKWILMEISILSQKPVKVKTLWRLKHIMKTDIVAKHPNKLCELIYVHHSRW